MLIIDGLLVRKGRWAALYVLLFCRLLVIWLVDVFEGWRTVWMDKILHGARLDGTVSLL